MPGTASGFSVYRVWGLEGLGFRVYRVGVWGLGFGVWGLGFGVWGLGFGVWGLGFGVWGLGFGVWGLGLKGVVGRCGGVGAWQELLRHWLNRNEGKILLGGALKFRGFLSSSSSYGSWGGGPLGSQA